MGSRHRSQRSARYRSDRSDQRFCVSFRFDDWTRAIRDRVASFCAPVRVNKFSVARPLTTSALTSHHGRTCKYRTDGIPLRTKFTLPLPVWGGGRGGVGTNLKYHYCFPGDRSARRTSAFGVGQDAPGGPKKSRKPQPAAGGLSRVFKEHRGRRLRKRANRAP